MLRYAIEIRRARTLCLEGPLPCARVHCVRQLSAMSQAVVSPAQPSSFLERHRFLTLFAILSTLMGTSVGMAKVATSLYSVELHASETLLGLIAASQSVGILVMSMPLGVLVDRYGPARPFMLGSLCAGIIYALIPLAHSAWYLLACTVAVSFFMPMRFVSLNTLFMRELMHIGVGKAGWYRGTHVIGMMLIGPTVSVAVTRALGVSGVYWLIAGMFALTIAISPIVFARYSSDETSSKPASRSLSPAELRGQFAVLLRERELRRTCTAELAVQSVNAFFTFFIVIIAVRTLGLGEGKATQLLAFEGGAYMVALFFFGEIVTRLGDERMYRASFALVTAALLLLGATAQAWLLSVGAALLGLGLGTVQIVNLTRFAQSGARLGRGKVSGLTPLVGTLGSLVGSLLGGVVGQSLGLQRVFLVYALAFVALLALLSRAREPELLSKPRRRSES